MDKEQIFLNLLKNGEIEIDDQGRIWRLKIRGGNPNRNPFIKAVPRRRVEFKQRQGYLLVTTNVEKKRVVTGAHRLVWAFCNGPIPEGMTINHKNGIKDDNRPENLELATYSENRMHALEILNVNRSRPQGSKHPKTHLTEQDVLEIRRLRQTGTMVKDLADQFKMTRKALSAICTRKTWKHI